MATVSRLPAVPWRAAVLVSYVIVNVVILAGSLRLGPHVATDWAVLSEIGGNLADGTVYDSGLRIPFVWSPVMAWILAGVTQLGYWPWVAAHLGSIFLLRRPLLIGMVLASYAFWLDTAEGNTVTFAFVAGALALRGSRWGALAFLALLLLTPRPVMAPLAVWILWHDRTLWRPFAAIFAVHSALVIASGLALPWLEAMLTYEGPLDISLGPTAWLGRWWLLAGVPIAAWLTWKGWVGWAGLVISPYVLHQYLIWPLLDLKKDEIGPFRTGTRRSTGEAHRLDVTSR